MRRRHSLHIHSDVPHSARRGINLNRAALRHPRIHLRLLRPFQRQLPVLRARRLNRTIPLVQQRFPPHRVEAVQRLAQLPAAHAGSVRVGAMPDRHVLGPHALARLLCRHDQAGEVVVKVEAGERRWFRSLCAADATRVRLGLPCGRRARHPLHVVHGWVLPPASGRQLACGAAQSVQEQAVSGAHCRATRRGGLRVGPLCRRSARGHPLPRVAPGQSGRRR
mmetsp:Transcript_16976/g.43514  ORF Transcript_16976/g.43514 Transcript_16976/m.43514 type:complete len:222 (+) Transcript_16976:143-808(+)